MSDSGKINECCGQSFGHDRRCRAAEKEMLAEMLQHSQRIVFDDGSMLTKFTDGKWYGECGAGMTKMRYDSPLEAFGELKRIQLLNA